MLSSVLVWSLVAGQLTAINILDLRSVRQHSRRIKTEEKAKVFAAAWGGHNFFQFLAELAFLHQDDWKKWMNRVTANERMIYTIPNRHLAKMVVLLKWLFSQNGCSPKMVVLPKWLFSQKLLFKIILAA